MSSKSQTRHPLPLVHVSIDIPMQTTDQSCSGEKNCMFIIFSSLFIIAIIIGVIFGSINYLDESTPLLSVSSATIHPFNISSSSQLTAAWNISLSFKNPSLVHQIDFVRVQADIYYGPYFLSNASISPFFLDSDTIVTRHARLMAHSVRVDECAAESIFKDLALGGRVDFHVVGVLVWRKHNFFPIKVQTKVVRVSCENLTVGFLGIRPGVFMGPRQKCKPNGGPLPSN